MNNREEKPGFGRRMTREEINKCVVKRYEGSVHLIRSNEDLAKAAEKLSREKVLGFDTETKPSFNKGEAHSPALLQLAGCDAVYLFQLTHLKFPEVLRAILANPLTIKAGFAPNQDIIKLKELGDFKQAGFVDLADVARRAGLKNHGLRGLAAVLLDIRISKRARVSNWERKTLSPEQIQYAATDAWVSRELFLRLQDKGYLIEQITSN